MIRTQRLLLRAWREEDLAPMARINADPLVGRFLRGRPETWEETVDLIEGIRRHWDQWGYGLWAVEHIPERRFLGFVGFSHHRRYPDDVEIGWRLDRAYWGRGLATEGAAAALRRGFTEWSFKRVISVIHRDNTVSRRVAEKIGLGLWREAELVPIVVYAIQRPGTMIVSTMPATRTGMTPKSWTEGTHQGVLHLGKGWYLVSATLDAAGIATGVRLDGPYASREEAEATKGRRL